MPKQDFKFKRKTFSLYDETIDLMKLGKRCDGYNSSLLVRLAIKEYVRNHYPQEYQKYMEEKKNMEE